MANLYNVGDDVICQKLGGQTGSKPKSPPFPGKVEQVLPGGEEYVVRLKRISYQTPNRHFPGGKVMEAEMQSA